MSILNAAIIVASAVAVVAATTVAPALLPRQTAEAPYPAPPSVTEPDVVALMEDAGNGPFFPYAGKFNGRNGGGSCGYRLAEGSTDAPTLMDCLTAVVQWGASQYHGRDGRQTQQFDTCVVAWHPSSSGVSVRGDDIGKWFETLMAECMTGDNLAYLSNYAYITDGTESDLGTFSAYHVDLPADGANCILSVDVGEAAADAWTLEHGGEDWTFEDGESSSDNWACDSGESPSTYRRSKLV